MFRQPPASLEPEATLERSIDEMNRKHEAIADAWGLGAIAHWSADQELGVITFSSAGGSFVRAPMQIIGSYNSAVGTWMWSWENPSVNQLLAQDARRARAFGEKYALWEFMDGVVECEEADAWKFRALCLHLGGGVGAYCGAESPTSSVFMTFGAVTIGEGH